MKKTDCTLYGYKSKAVISDCGKYRYELYREWDEKKGKVLFIMLNPSTADAHRNDLTTRRCMNFAKKWGYGGIMIGNLYPFRAKRPKDLRKWEDSLWNERVGATAECYHVLNKNEEHVKQMANEADILVCAWGCNVLPYLGIPHWVEELGDLHYLELCKDGITPKHPLGNLSKDLEPKLFPTEQEQHTKWLIENNCGDWWNGPEGPHY